MSMDQSNDGYHATGFKHTYSAYTRGKCKCDVCRTAWRNYSRKARGYQPSKLALEVDRLNREADAMELNLEALREENSMLHCRLHELEP